MENKLARRNIASQKAVKLAARTSVNVVPSRLAPNKNAAGNPTTLKPGRHQTDQRVKDSGNGAAETLPIVDAYIAPPSPRTTPSERVLSQWRNANAVCFDVDCTVTVNDSLDIMGEFMGVADQVAALTSKAMDGSMDLEQSLDERLKIINCTPEDIRKFVQANPPESRLAPGITELIKSLQARGVDIYFISGGFRELIAPIAIHLGVPLENVFANRMMWQWDDATGLPSRLVGCDLREPTSRNRGKPEAIARIRNENPYNTVVMIGDGITDLEAVQDTGGADLFIGYGGVIERPMVAQEAEWFVYSHRDLVAALRTRRVAVIGGGAWACAAARIIAYNCMTDDPAEDFVDEVKMWIHESDWEGSKLTSVINTTHVNPKYLPNVSLGENVVATADLYEAVKDADVLVFCVPHQFMHGLCQKLMGKVKPDAIAISLVKGMRVGGRDGLQLISQMIQKTLRIDCSVLMGPNIAKDVGDEQLSEAVIGYTDRENAKVFVKLFSTSYFVVNMLPDTVGVELCGTLKNIVALGCGMVDGLGYGSNSKATIIRQGLWEMRAFSKALYPNVRDETFFESCGVGDLVATCYGGRNRAVALAWVKAWKEGKPSTFQELEKSLLKGQKLQGVLTSDEVQEILKRQGWERRFPLFTTINRIVNGQLDPSWIVKYKEAVRVKKVNTVDVEPMKAGEIVKVEEKPENIGVKRLQEMDSIFQLPLWPMEELSKMANSIFASL